MISARIIADSQSPSGDRITTFVLVMPRIVLSEFNTHRAISRNSASSRAIPFNKMMDMVLQKPFIPIKWMKDHKGMQGSEYFEGDESEKLNRLWLQAQSEAVERAQQLSMAGVTKQVCNRLLEPFMWHTVIATATDWENFFALRAHDAAEIHIQDLAYKMLAAYNSSTPERLEEGQWHIPFGDQLDISRLKELEVKLGTFDRTKLAIKIATARCARISYNNFEGKDDYEADIKLHDSLLASGHMSPFEHCATPQEDPGYLFSGNFYGFTQYRKTIEGENKFDERVIHAK